MFVCLFVKQVPHVNRTDYQLIDISEDGFVCTNFHFSFIIPLVNSVFLSGILFLTSFKFFSGEFTY
jgi:hypothetical protein